MFRDYYLIMFENISTIDYRSMKNNFLKDFSYYLISLYIISFLSNLYSVRDFYKAFELMLYESVEIILGSFLISYIFYIRKKSKIKR